MTESLPAGTAPPDSSDLSLLLRVSVGTAEAGARTTDDDVADVVVTARPGARVGDLVDAVLRRWAGDDDERGVPFECRRAGGAVVDQSSLLIDAPIAHGDHLVLVPVGRSTRSSHHAAGVVPRLVLAPRDPHSAESPTPLAPGRVGVGRSARDNQVVIDDASVSRRHASIEVGAHVTVRDLGSTNGTVLDGEPLLGIREICVGSVLRFGDVEMQVRAPSDSVDERGAATDAGVWIDRSRPDEPLVAGARPFNRPPRIGVPVASVALRAPEPPMPPTEHRLPWVSALVPVALAAIVVVISIAAGSGSGLGGGYAVVSALFLLMSPIMIVASHWESKRASRRATAKADAAFDASMVRLRRRVTVAVADERDARLERHGGVASLFARTANRDGRLWEAATHPRTIRVGTATLPSSVSIERPMTGGGAHAAAIDEVERLASTLAGVPVVVDVAELSGLAVVGPPAWRDGVARWLVLQMATTVPPSLLSIEITTADPARWDWVKWLPRCGAPSAVRLLVIDQDGSLDTVAVARVAEAGGTADTLVVWLGGERSAAPSVCNAVLEPSRLLFAASGRVVTPLDVDVVDERCADRWARLLAPLVESVPVGRARAVPAAVGIAEVMPGGEGRVADLVDAIRGAWADRPSSLVASIGRSASGTLDIDLRRDGPHAVIAGTTGAGKSELLQTMVVSMATWHPPSRVSFLLVDYKGGAAFGACASLPHTVGIVTDLDDGLVDRVLVSLGAEVRRREAILAGHGVKDLAALERLGVPDTPASLVVLVDEFASIAAEVPTFMSGMIDIARRGRSLGLHLVLATQRPAGVVSDQLRANANLRIALRVADVADSTDVVGSPDAARIDRSMPGRALARLGERELIEFQAAYCGGRSLGAGALPAPSELVTLQPFALVAPNPEVAAPADDLADGPTDGPADLPLLVAAIRRAAALDGGGRPRRPWLPPLPEDVPLLDLIGLPGAGPASLTIGLVDDPARQAQDVATIDLDAHGSVLVYAGGSTAADALRTMTIAATVGRSLDDVRVDVIDGGAGSLSTLQHLPHVGSVIAIDDAERVGRLLAELLRHVRSGRSDSSRRILVVNDLIGFAAAHDPADGGRSVESIARLVSEGAPALVHVIASADRRIGVPLAVSSGVGCRVVTALHSDDDLAGLGVHRRVLGDVPGRAVMGGLLVQLARPPVGAEWATLVERERERCNGSSAPAVGALPDHVDLRSVATAVVGTARSPSSRTCVVVGIGDGDLEPVVVDLSEGNLLVAGPLRSGRTSALGALAATLTSDVRTILISARTTAWSAARGWDECAIGSAAVDLVARVHRSVERGVGPTVVFVDDATDIDGELDDALVGLAALSRDRDLRLVVAAEAALARVAYGGVVASVRRSRRALLLQPDVELDGDLVGVRLPRRRTSEVPVGRAELVDRGRITGVQVAFTLPTMGGDPHGRPVGPSVR